jgi:hypothetical protein
VVGQVHGGGADHVLGTGQIQHIDLQAGALEHGSHLQDAQCREDALIEQEAGRRDDQRYAHDATLPRASIIFFRPGPL